MKSAYVYIPHLIRGSAALMMPVKENPRVLYSLNQLRAYSFQEWNGQYYVRNGWGQDVGWVEDEETAYEYCKMMRESMRFQAVVICEKLTFPFGTECDILDMDRHWDSDCRLSYHGCQFWAGRGQWRFKIILDSIN